MFRVKISYWINGFLLLLLAVVSVAGYWIFSEKRHQGADLFFANNYLDWHSAYEIKVFASEWQNSDRWINQPPLTWIPLFRIRFLTPLAKWSQTQCVLYRVPYLRGENVTLGILKVVEVGVDSDCSNLEDSKALRQQEGFSGLAFYISSERGTLRGGSEVLRPFELVIVYRTISSQHDLVQKSDLDDRVEKIPLLNMERSDLEIENTSPSFASNYTLERFRSSVPDGYIKGAKFFPYMWSSLSFPSENLARVKGRGSFADDYALGTQVKCYDVQSDCTVTMEFQCDQCRFGWFEVINDSKCPGGGPKYCGVNRCGGKMRPACWRGWFYQEIDEKQGCSENSQVGFCQKGLMTSCDANNVLICI